MYIMQVGQTINNLQSLCTILNDVGLLFLSDDKLPIESQKTILFLQLSIFTLEKKNCIKYIVVITLSTVSGIPLNQHNCRNKHNLSQPEACIFTQSGVWL